MNNPPSGPWTPQHSHNIWQQSGQSSHTYSLDPHLDIRTKIDDLCVQMELLISKFDEIEEMVTTIFIALDRMQQ